MKTIHKLYLAVFALAALVACGEGSGRGTVMPQATGFPPIVLPSGVTPPPSFALTPPPGSIYLGVYVNPFATSSPPATFLDKFETSIGRHVALSPHYYGFFDTFPGAAEAHDITMGRIPFISWNCQPSNAAIASGKADLAIKKVADNIAAFQYPVFIRYMWEMNLSSANGHKACYDPNTDLHNGYFSPSEFIAAWLRIRYIFAVEKVRNAVWVWNPSGGSDPIQYYPGPNAVDWVAFDFYDRQNYTVPQVYQQIYAWLQPLNKPILVGETGATQAFQNTYFPQVVPAMSQLFPQIKAFVYFDATQAFNGIVFDWRLSPDTLPDFQAMATDPYMSAMPTLSPMPPSGP